MDTKSRRKFPRKRTRKPHSTKPADFAEAANKPPAEPQIVMESEFQQYYYSLVESIPVPEPTWSTTAPAVLCAAPPEAAEDALEFEWAAENEGEAWWVGFLKSLDDCKSGKGGQENTAVAVAVAVESCKEAAAAAMDPSGTFPEDWLCFPAAEDHGDEPAA